MNTSYFNKYKKYKLKYLNLLKQKGGANITINLDKYKELFRRFVFELDYEMAFSIDEELENQDIISEFIKGKPLTSEDIDQPLFDKNITFTHLNCHTHNRNGCSNEYTGVYCPPSASDYKMFINNYCRYYTTTSLIFSSEGIYEVSIGDDLIRILNENEELRIMLKREGPISRRYNSIARYEEWDNFLEQIDNITDTAHVLLSKPKFLDKYEGLFEEIKRKQTEELKLPMIETLEDYFTVIRHLGFNIKLYTWGEPLVINIRMKQNAHDFIDSAIIARINGTLYNLLLMDPDDIREDDIYELNTNLRVSNYINLDEYSTDDLFDIIK